jgi:hypothetical protein
VSVRGGVRSDALAGGTPSSAAVLLLWLGRMCWQVLGLGGCGKVGQLWVPCNTGVADKEPNDV